MQAPFRTTHFALLESVVPQLLAGPEAFKPIAKRTASTPGAVSIQGVLGPASDWYSQSNYEDIRAQVRLAASDPRAKTVDLFIDSPGGSVLGLPETADTIFQANKRKPVRAFVTGIAASAAYWLASQASTIQVTPSGEVGSIGVLDIHADISKALENSGVKITAVHAGEHKVERAPFTPLSDVARAEMQRGVDEWYGKFLSAIRRGRGARVAGNATFGDGRMLDAQHARLFGLVDFVTPIGEVL